MRTLGHTLGHTLAATAVVVLSSCIQSTIEKLPAYDLAVSIGGPEAPKVFYVDEIDTGVLPAAVPFAVFAVSHSNRLARETLARSGWRSAEHLKADILLIGTAETFQSGSTNYYVGSGMGFSKPMHGAKLAIVAYRVCRARIGVSYNSSNMILTIDNQSIRNAGVLEGDTLLSIAGVSRTTENTSPHFEKLLEIEPGDEVELVWIRPGVGRMSGVATAMPNHEAHLDFPNSIERHRPRQH